jgi:hypothetical protein
VTIGTVLSGYLVAANFGDTQYWYSQRSDEREYRCGYFYPATPAQTEKCIKDAIQSVEEDGDTVTFRCRNSTYAINTNSPIEYQNAKTGFSLSLLPKPTHVDDLGVIHVGSVQRCETGKKVMICSDLSVRFYDRNGYSDDQALHQIKTQIKKITSVVNSHYNPRSGWIIWTAEEE